MFDKTIPLTKIICIWCKNDPLTQGFKSFNRTSRTRTLSKTSVIECAVTECPTCRADQNSMTLICDAQERRIKERPTT